MDVKQKKLFLMAKKYFKENKSDYLHDFDHTLRVISWIKLLSEKENANLTITIPSAILHDIGMPKYGDEKHASLGAKLAKPMLKTSGYSNAEIEQI